MQIILLKDVEKLGLRGDVVDVARGYARNFLLPRRLAEVATPARVKELERVEAQRALHEARDADQAQEIAEVLRQTVLRFEVKSGPTGSLFGSVTPSDIADELWRTRKIRVDRRKVATDPIKRIGRFSIPIAVFEGVEVEVKTLVVPEGGDLPPEEELVAIEAAEAAAAAEAEAAVEAERAAAKEAIADVIEEEEVEEAEPGEGAEAEPLDDAGEDDAGEPEAELAEAPAEAEGDGQPAEAEPAEAEPAAAAAEPARDDTT